MRHFIKMQFIIVSIISSNKIIYILREFNQYEYFTHQRHIIHLTKFKYHAKNVRQAVANYDTYEYIVFV